MPENIDLAVECSELRGVPEGVDVKREKLGADKVTTITVSTGEAAAKLGKPVGTYITVEFAETPSDPDSLVETAQRLAAQIGKLLPKEGELLFCGIGNSRITPDSLGPVVAANVLATRHLPKNLPDMPVLRPVSSVAPGVLALTGVETAELIAGLTARLKPSAVITADALAARRLSRLCRTVQISDSGIAPGSGVGNSRACIDSGALGCKVISIGVPLVVDGLTLSMDLMNIDQSERGEYEKRLPQAGGLMVTPQDIDNTAAALGKLIGLAFNLAAQPGTDPGLLLSVV